MSERMRDALEVVLGMVLILPSLAVILLLPYTFYPTGSMALFGISVFLAGGSTIVFASRAYWRI